MCVRLCVCGWWVRVGEGRAAAMQKAQLCAPKHGKDMLCNKLGLC